MKNNLLRHMKMVGVVILLIAMTACSKNIDAEKVAKGFLQDINDGKAYKMTHHYVESDESLELYKDAKGNAHLIFTYEDATMEEIYCVDGEFVCYLDSALNTELESELLKDITESVLEEAPYYIDDTIEVFSRKIDSDIIDLEEENLFRALGSYEDGSRYYYSYGKDGNYFDYYDDYDEIEIYLDDSIKIELPKME